MATLASYIQEVSLGIVDDPHTGRPMVLTEMVTVCPSCHSFHSLRVEENRVRCVACEWSPKKRRRRLMPPAA